MCKLPSFLEFLKGYDYDAQKFDTLTWIRHYTGMGHVNFQKIRTWTRARYAYGYLKL